jgi:predicted type IV restriction endonuclease
VYIQAGKTSLHGEIDMDFVDQLKSFAETIPSQLDHIKTEEATKSALVMPFIQILGYNVFNLSEVVPEFDANVGATKKYKLDYAILDNGKPIILFECKCYGSDLNGGDEWSQLHHYFVATEARFGVLTNGVIYRFYSDLEKPNKMDDTPFLELNLSQLNEHAINQIKKLTKSSFSVDEAIHAANEMKYKGGIKSVFKRQLDQPSDDFVKLFFKEVCPGNVFTGNLKDLFIQYTKSSFKEFIREEIDKLLNEASAKNDFPVTPLEEEKVEISNAAPEFTEEEKEGFYIVKSILAQIVDLHRISYRDTLSYCNVLLDDNGWKAIVRFYFNNTKSKKLELVKLNDKGEKEYIKISIDSINDIYKYSQQIQEIVLAYDSKSK